MASDTHYFGSDIINIFLHNKESLVERFSYFLQRCANICCYDITQTGRSSADIVGAWEQIKDIKHYPHHTSWAPFISMD